MRTRNTAFLTTIALVAFAANSVLCRLALGQHLIDAASFTSVRVISGATVLALIVLIRQQKVRMKPDWRSGLPFFIYMVFFSFAYMPLGVGTGPWLAFAALHLPLLAVALLGGEHFSLRSGL